MILSNRERSEEQIIRSLGLALEAGEAFKELKGLMEKKGWSHGH